MTADILTKTEETLKSPPRPSAWRRLAPHVAALTLAAGLVVFVPLRWTRWIGSADWQTTDDASVRGDLTPLSAKVGGYVRRVLVSDYQRVRRGDPLVEIADDDYRAQVDQAEANVAAAEAAVANNRATQALQLATIKAADAGLAATRADLTRYALEAQRQHTLVQSAASSRQTLEQADANLARTSAVLEQGQAQAEATRRQLDVLKAQERQLGAQLDAARAALKLARISLSYTRIESPEDGMVGERQVRAGQLVSAGSQVITVVPSRDVWIVANYKETQLARVRPGQRVEISVDSLSGATFRGRVETIAPASGSQFALLPPDNASGNFTKVVQRVSVRIALDPGDPLRDRLRPGLSVVASIDTRVGSARESGE